MRKSASKALRFTKIKLQSWRNFTEVDVDLQRRVFLIGPNASGKSNFLDVFRFLRDIVSVGGGFQDAVLRRGGVSKLRCLAARRYSNIVIHVHIGNGDDENVPAWEYELDFNQDKQRRPYILRERVAKSGSDILRRAEARFFWKSRNSHCILRLFVTFPRYLHAFKAILADRYCSAPTRPTCSGMRVLVLTKY